MKKLLLLSVLFCFPAYGKPITLSKIEKTQLAKTVYMEDRQHGNIGMMTIAHLIFNRSKSGIFPKKILGVIHQKYQFTSWNHPKRINTKSKKYQQAKLSVVKSVSLYNRGIDLSNHALYYTRYDCHPKWRKHMKVTKVFGVHVFMRKKK